MIIRDMQINEFVSVMEANADLFPDYMALPIETKQFMAKINIMTGTAKSFTDEDGTFFGCAGVRYIGFPEGQGEVWAITPPDIRKDKRFTFLREAKAFLKQQVDSLKLRQCYATTIMSETFLAHLGFEKISIPIWTKKL